MTTAGFFSAAEDRADRDRVLVRTRVRQDAEHLAAAVGGRLIESPEADYRFRVSTTKEEWSQFVAEQATEVDYDNFKNAVADRQGAERASVYGEVWSRLLRLQRGG